MRPSRGRQAANNRAKPCFVRLEKVTPPKEDKDDDVHKKLTGPLKKRPVVIKRSPVGRPRKIEIDEDLSSYNLVTARSRRTPKPNPKYSTDHVMSTTIKSRDNRGDSMMFEEESDDLPEPEDEDEELALSTEGEEPLSEEEEDDSSEDDKMRRRTVMRMRKSISPPRKRRPGRPRTKTSPIQRKQTSDSEKAKAFELRRKKVDWEKPKNDEESSIIARNKRLNIELYDASDSDVPAASPTPGRRGRPPTKHLASSSKASDMVLTRVQPRAEVTKKFGSISQIRRALQNETDDESPKQRTDEEDDVEMTTGAASTLDDFETMPTFTIVNINDIINKKGDVLTNKSPNEEDSNASSAASRNRRKSMHTTILSDKIDQSKLIPPPRSPFPPRKPTTSLNTLNNNSLSKSLISSSSIDGFKSAPRILNSVVGKKTKPVTPLVSKLATKDRTSDTSSNFESLLSKQSKENVHINTYGHASSTHRKLPNEKILVQRQGNKVIKKITCFETWYVINIPPYEQIVPKNIFDMSLTELGNRSNEINLPSNMWNYKITLQKMTETQLAKGNYQEFTGELQDSSIPDSEKHKYQPINIMFRRNNLNQKLRMPFDRAVIFKNKTYFINMDGKNVRLTAAPQNISNIDDVEAVLEIVDDMGLNHDLVEHTSFIQ